MARISARLLEDITYVRGSEDPRQQLDLYLPQGTSGYPMLVFVHGGYWVAQDKRYHASILGLYGNVGIALAREGIGVAVINYRLVPDVTFEDEMSDVLAALAWTQANGARHGGDGSRLVLAGHSAGGHMTALAAFQEERLVRAGIDPSAVRGYVALSPIFDLEHMAAHPPASDHDERVTKPVFGDRLKEYSPRTYFSGAVKPLFIAMGQADEPYLVTQIPEAVKELEALGAPVSLTTLPGRSHADVVLEFDTGKDALSPAIAEFVQRVTR